MAKMEKHFSLYLDTVRFMAAIFVVLTHFNQHSIVDKNIAYLLPDLGREAVMIFFVLSGYVIAHTTAIKKQSIKQYVVARSARIYSVALPLLLAAFVVAFFTEIYTEKNTSSHYQIVKAYLYIPFHGLFLGELWNLSETPPWLAAYWSLGYEVWYYVFFASLYFFRGWRRLIFGTIIFLIMGHKLWLLLPIWLSGVVLYRWHDQYVVGKKAARIGWVTSLFVLTAYKYFDCEIYLRTLGGEIWPFVNLKLGSADRYLGDYIICGIVLCNFYFSKYAKFSFLVNFSDSIKNISSYTFTLYLGHSLVISVWRFYYRNDPSSYIDIFVISLFIGLFTYMVGRVTEHKKTAFAMFFERLHRGGLHNPRRSVS